MKLVRGFIKKLRLFIKEYRPTLAFLFIYYLLPPLYMSRSAVHLRYVICSSPLFVPALKKLIQGFFILSTFNVRQRRVSPPVNPLDYDDYYILSDIVFGELLGSPYYKISFGELFCSLNSGALHQNCDDCEL